MKRNYRKYSDSDIIEFAKEVKSIAGLLRKLELKVVGANYVNIKKNLQRLKVNTDHWTGRAWNKDQQLKDYSDYTRSSRLKPHLIQERGHTCEDCGLSEWKEQPITLELHHLDGHRGNNVSENLLLLCPNCHSQTNNWRR